MPDRLRNLRYSFARWLDRRLKKACWVDLYDWSQGVGDDSLLTRSKGSSTCMNDRAANCGACWCGKNRAAVSGGNVQQ